MIYNMSLILESLTKERGWADDGSERMVSYLPLSHSAAQGTDLLLPMLGHVTLTFAKPDALQGSLLETLKEVRPTLFFAVPRVWEKFEEKLKEIGDKAGSLAKSISMWAKDKALRHNLNM
jgi:long-chain-fatty-acid--CoA ligase ACSBG